jgi:uncharacterized protein (DUF302 family)
VSNYGRRIVIDSDFDTVVSELRQAMCEEGLQVIARFDVRDHFRRHAGRDFRRYLLLEASSPDLALEAFRDDLDAGTILPTTFVVYELADGETAVVAKEPLSPMADDPRWRTEVPVLAAVADRESERIARVLPRLQHRGSKSGTMRPAA